MKLVIAMILMATAALMPNEAAKQFADALRKLYAVGVGACVEGSKARPNQAQ